MAAWVTPLSASSASRRWSWIGSGVVCESGAATAPSTPTVPKLTAVSPSASQIWRVKLAQEVLPLVPVTATITSGWLPKKRRAAMASAWRGLSERTTGHGERAGGLGEREAGGVGQDGDGAHAERVGDELGAVHAAAGEGGEEVAGAGLAAVDAEAGDLGEGARPVAGAAGAGEEAQRLEARQFVRAVRSGHGHLARRLSVRGAPLGDPAIRFLRACKAAARRRRASRAGAGPSPAPGGGRRGRAPARRSGRRCGRRSC